jgi:hypothetical protein
LRLNPPGSEFYNYGNVAKWQAIADALGHGDKQQARIADLESALEAIEFATRPDSGSFWLLRSWLKDRDIYGDDVSEEHVFNLVARSLITPRVEP